MITEEEQSNEADKYYEGREYPSCENDSDEMYAMTVEHFKYSVVYDAYIAGMKKVIEIYQQGGNTILATTEYEKLRVAAEKWWEYVKQSKQGNTSKTTIK